MKIGGQTPEILAQASKSLHEITLHGTTLAKSWMPFLFAEMDESDTGTAAKHAIFVSARANCR